MKTIYWSLLVCTALLVGCMQDFRPQEPEKGDASVEVTLQVQRVGALSKSTASSAIELSQLHVSLRAAGEATIYDTIALTGNQSHTVAKTYSGLTADRQWTVEAFSLDNRGVIVHRDTATFLSHPQATEQVTLNLSARYSMLVANCFPIRDSITGLALVVDSQSVADTSFAKQSLLGDTVRLDYDYLTASPLGSMHSIRIDAIGDFNGVEQRLYTCDTMVTVYSGQDAYYALSLRWVGPDDTTNATSDLAMTVVLGAVGTVFINAQFEQTQSPACSLVVLAGASGSLGVPSPEIGEIGDSFPLVAIADSSHDFFRWELLEGTAIIENPASDSTSVTVLSDYAAVRALFTEAAGYTLYVTQTGPGYTFPDSATSLDSGDVVTISARPGTGYTLAQWVVDSGDLRLSDSLSDSTMVTVYSSGIVRAEFTQQRYNIAALADTGGQASAYPSSVTYGGSCNLSAHPSSSNYEFTGWSLLQSGGATIQDYSDPTTLLSNIRGDVIVRANFRLRPRYTLTVTSSGPRCAGSTSPSGTISVLAGDTLLILADARCSYTCNLIMTCDDGFNQWRLISGAATILNPLSRGTGIVVNGNTEVRAEY